MVRGMVEVATELGAALLAVLSFRDAYAEPRTSRGRRRKLCMGALGVFVALGTIYVGHVQTRGMAFVKAVSAASAHAMFGGI